MGVGARVRQDPLRVGSADALDLGSITPFFAGFKCLLVKPRLPDAIRGREVASEAFTALGTSLPNTYLRAGYANISLGVPARFASSKSPFSQLLNA